MEFIKTSTLLLLTWQTHAGWSQDIRKTMLEQLAAYKVYTTTAEKGYQLAEEGLHLVRDIKSGEFHLHEVYFHSLRSVDEATLQSPAVNEVFRLVSSIDRDFEHLVHGCVSSGWLPADELQYIRMLQVAMNENGLNALKELQVLTTDGVLSMTDGERIGRIEKIATALRRRYGQIKSFLAGISWLISQRQKEQAFTGTLKKWYGIQ